MNCFKPLSMFVGLSLSAGALAAPTLDTSFNASGMRSVFYDLPTEKWDEATDVVVQPDGKTVVVGFARRAPINGTGDVSDLTVARLLANGGTDLSFASNGKLVLNLGSGGRFNDRANAVALDSAGRIYVVGNTENSTRGQGFVIRLTPTGQLDSTFALGGRFVLTDGSANPGAYRFNDVAIDSAGRLLVVGTVEKTTGTLNQGYAMRLLSNGQFDTSFTGGTDNGNSVGYRELSLFQGAAFNDEIQRVEIAPDGSIYAAGSFQGVGNDFDFVVYKLNPTNGALVPSFGNGGWTRRYIDQGDKYDRLVDMKVLPNGNLRLLGNCRLTLPNGFSPMRACMIGLTSMGAIDAAIAGSPTTTPFATIPLNIECNGVGGEARSMARVTGHPDAFWIIGEQRACATSVPQMAMMRVGNTGFGTAFNIVYSTTASWANAGTADALGRLVVVGGTVLSASDTDQAVARISGY